MWQRRPLEEFYPVVYLDAIRVKVRVDHRVASRSAHIAVGAGHGRYQARGLSIWAPGPGREPPSGHMCAPSWPTGASRTC